MASQLGAFLLYPAKLMTFIPQNKERPALVSKRENAGLAGKTLDPMVHSEANKASFALSGFRNVIDKNICSFHYFYTLFHISVLFYAPEAILLSLLLPELISYKQGLNEVLAPFYTLAEPPLPEELIYKLFEAFVKRYAKTFASF